MPIITVHGPALPDADKKREMLKEITDACEKAYGTIARDSFIILLRETCPETVAIGGKLLADRRKKPD